eukprot:CAMPEP_0183782922 /NCGR_PEP_ID=MMETSP0739-20130205/62260_1 /TAXON_ID=385413 /ORGANISM="Thalassiosira miniscula, Strain CCMP1093" /LENGTH=56 /DNA_ID=CAMNT_0026026479 /DNA_START=164 /DNA_END=330 /DNA_ORIENTATION=-
MPLALKLRCAAPAPPSSGAVASKDPNFLFRPAAVAAVVGIAGAVVVGGGGPIMMES